MEENISELNTALSGKLIIGNHELLDIYGNDVQNRLREVSRNITSILLSGNNELETNLAQVMEGLNEIDNTGAGDKNYGLRSRKINKSFKKKYQDILDYIDHLTLLLQLQQAQILKDNVILDNYAKQVHECELELSEYIDYAKKVYCQTMEDINEGAIKDNNTIQNWANRLQKRIDALKTSHVVALQSEQELAMLKDNNSLLLDKISDAISNAIPLWQMQVTISLGLENSEYNQRLQNNIMHKTNSYLGQTRKMIDKQSKLGNIPQNIQELISNNKKLQELLKDLNDVEEKDKSIKETIVNLQ